MFGLLQQPLDRLVVEVVHHVDGIDAAVSACMRKAEPQLLCLASVQRPSLSRVGGVCLIDGRRICDGPLHRHLGRREPPQSCNDSLDLALSFGRVNVVYLHVDQVGLWVVHVKGPDQKDLNRLGHGAYGLHEYRG